MDWKISFDEKAERQFARLSPDARLRIAAYLDGRLVREADPRELGKALRGVRRGFWRYRVGDYRLNCELRDQELLVLVMEIGHRSKVYR